MFCFGLKFESIITGYLWSHVARAFVYQSVLKWLFLWLILFRVGMFNVGMFDYAQSRLLVSEIQAKIEHKK